MEPGDDTNPKGAWLAAQSTARRMVRHGVGGSVVNIASILGLHVAGAVAPYSKAEASRRCKSAKCGRAKTSCNSSISGATPSYLTLGLNSAFCIASATGPRFCSIDCHACAQADRMSNEVTRAAANRCNGATEGSSQNNRSIYGSR